MGRAGARPSNVAFLFEVTDYWASPPYFRLRYSSI